MTKKIHFLAESMAHILKLKWESTEENLYRKKWKFIKNLGAGVSNSTYRCIHTLYLITCDTLSKSSIPGLSFDSLLLSYLILAQSYCLKTACELVKPKDVKMW